jgi:hypothetical protein
MTNEFNEKFFNNEFKNNKTYNLNIIKTYKQINLNKILGT